jgi:myo-inositol-1(or 4)-monophosphatase
MTRAVVSDPRIAACYDIATRAADLARVIPPTAMGEKANGDVSTLVDIAAQNFIVEELSRRFPEDRIRAEEGTPRSGSGCIRWEIDPLDGTLNFKRHVGPWAVSIAAVRHEDILVGCVADGSNGDVFTAAQGFGAQRNGRTIQVSATNALTEALVGFDCPYDHAPRMRTTFPAVGELLRESKALRCYGSCAIALCKIATGELDAYAVEYGKSWDFAAGTLLVREAGGKVTNWAGDHYYPEHNTQVLATNSTLHEAVKPLLKAHVCQHPTT